MCVKGVGGGEWVAGPVILICRLNAMPCMHPARTVVRKG